MATRKVPRDRSADELAVLRQDVAALSELADTLLRDLAFEARLTAAEAQLETAEALIGRLERHVGDVGARPILKLLEPAEEESLDA